MSKDNWRSLIHDIQFELPGIDQSIQTRDVEMRFFPNLMTEVILSEQKNNVKNALIHIKALINEKKIPLIFPEHDEELPSLELSHTLQLRWLHYSSGKKGLKIMIFPSALPHLLSGDDREQSVDRVRQVMYETSKDYQQLIAQNLFQPGNPPYRTGFQK